MGYQAWKQDTEGWQKGPARQRRRRQRPYVVCACGRWDFADQRPPWGSCRCGRKFSEEDWPALPSGAKGTSLEAAAAAAATDTKELQLEGEDAAFAKELFRILAERGITVPLTIVEKQEKEATESDRYRALAAARRAAANAEAKLEKAKKELDKLEQALAEARARHQVLADEAKTARAKLEEAKSHCGCGSGSDPAATSGAGAGDPQRDRLDVSAGLAGAKVEQGDEAPDAEMEEQISTTKKKLEDLQKQREESKRRRLTGAKEAKEEDDQRADPEGKLAEAKQAAKEAAELAKAALGASLASPATGSQQRG